MMPQQWTFYQVLPGLVTNGAGGTRITAIMGTALTAMVLTLVGRHVMGVRYSGVTDVAAGQQGARTIRVTLLGIEAAGPLATTAHIRNAISGMYSSGKRVGRSVI